MDDTGYTSKFDSEPLEDFTKCTGCGGRVEDMDDGYSDCCNEPCE